jgi:NAD(P)-dependent dehydrogenase (short-subunit alcohol dehydrogenase family)
MSTAPHRLVVLTGASRGLGAALAEQLLAPDLLLLTLSRQPDATLAARAAASGTRLEQWAIDLAHGAEAAARLEDWLQQQAQAPLRSAALINNAALLGSVGPVEASAGETLAAVLRVGREAPLLLTPAFLRATRNWAVDKRVLTISSGAGQRPIAGWTAYCAAKAGVDHASRVMALDEALLPNPARIVALAPGVIDTDMQGELRTAPASGFPEQDNFMQLKMQGQLATPHAAAARVLAFLHRDDFGRDPVADVRLA